MQHVVPIDDARALFPEYEFVTALTPSAQKAAFHVRRGEEDLCLKLISPNYGNDRLHREILAMQTIEHPNVVRLLEYEFSAKAEAQRHYLVEEFVAGADLSDHLVADKPWPIAKILEIFGPLLSGLEELRRAEIVHRDLKPNNIRVRTDGAPVIIDFGLARHLDLSSITPTAHGAALGTPRYFAPEQFLGTRRDIDHRTDLYAIGVMMYEAAVGAHPSMTHETKTLEQLSKAVCESSEWKTCAEFDVLPNNLKMLIRRLLSKARSGRPPTAALTASMLQKVGDET